MNRVIGKVAATEKQPTTIDEFYFWTSRDLILNPFDVVRVDNVNSSTTFGVIEEISHITDSPSYLTSFISNDFGDISASPNTQRIGMNYVKAKVVGNTKNIYIPVNDGENVGFATKEEIQQALGLDNVKNPLVCGYLEMYKNLDDDIKVKLPVHLNSKFLIGPEGAHLNISGISGLASKTSYAMFLLKSIQHEYLKAQIANDKKDDVAFVLLNVKGKDLLAIDEPNEELKDSDKAIYNDLGLDSEPFRNVKYYYPFSDDYTQNTYASKAMVEDQINQEKAYRFKYVYDDDGDEADRKNLDMLFANIDDPNQTMESIVNYVISGQGNFSNIRDWDSFQDEVAEHCKSGRGQGGEITVQSWRKFKRIISKTLSNPIFAPRVVPEKRETRIQDAIKTIRKNEVCVFDIAKLNETLQGFVFGDVMRAVYDLQLGQFEDVDEKDIPSKIVIFIDELNKYASSDVPKSSPILRQIIDISERGRSLGIILFSAEQFKSSIHERVKGNCSTHAYGRTNAIEISKNDYRFVPSVYKNMMTRLEQGEYIVQNPIFRSLLNIKFPKPLYKQFK
ncbi:ATP-binding protein [Carboxylicivirga mesophila]|uniref:ATP-binding protein n=1 Tax=Carboxylicivirga mesophila TaxID=1166478 RepID=A0ABS5K5K8_9BACT|nr:ATP-binding protein [Carboxylicivirga mesophila]MBS2210259.1 ATP-binding protein [Carboxylicivirga mesophila]